MAKWARIEDSEVREVIDFDPEGRFDPALVWVECGDDVGCYWVYDSKAKKFSRPVEQEVIPSPELPSERIGEALEAEEAPTE
jgi:hypothetical protein